jgi:hypothetical protein
MAKFVSGKWGIAHHDVIQPAFPRVELPERAPTGSASLNPGVPRIDIAPGVEIGGIDSDRHLQLALGT